MFRKVAIASMAICAMALLESASAQTDSGVTVQPAYTLQVGPWSIVGFVIGRGNTVVCKMQEEASDANQFAYMTGVSAGADGIKPMAMFVTTTGFPDNSSPTVAISFLFTLFSQPI